MGLFLGTAVLFGRSIQFGFLDYDDPDYVTQNVHIQHGFNGPDVRRAFISGHAANWHPLTWLSHMLDWRLFGDQPHGHHATNVLLHSLNAVFVFLALRRLTGAFWTSAFCAAIFAWHPLRVESVAWISERKDLLCGFFGLATIWAYAVYADRRRTHRGGWGFYGLALIAFALGLLSKAMLVTLPFVLVLLDFWPLRRTEMGKSFREWISNSTGFLLEKLPFFVLAAGSCFATYHFQKAGGAVVSRLSLQSRFANAAVSVVLYLKMMIWPIGLAVGYPFPDQRAWSIVAAAVGFIFLISAVTILQWRRRPWILIGWLWFSGMLVPVIGIVKVGMQGMADRYTYLPMLGVELAMLWSVRDLLPASWKKGMWSCAILVLMACAGLTWNQLGIWQDQRSLYEHALAVTQDNFLAESYLGSYLANAGRLEEARGHLRRAVEIKPSYCDGRYKLGVILDRLGRADEAEAQYQQVLAMAPEYPHAHLGLAVILMHQDRAAEALPHLEAALRENDEDADVWLAMGMAHARLQHMQQAINCYEKLIAMNPTNAEAFFDYANALDQFDRDEEALPQYEKAVQINPHIKGVFCNWGNALRKLKRLDAACDIYHWGISMDPADADSLYGLASALDDMGHGEEARANLERAVEIRPAFAEAQYDLGAMLLNDGHAEAALAHLQAAVRSRGDFEAAYLGLGLAEAQLGHLDGAITFYRRAILLNPKDADAIFNLGVALDSVGQPGEAIKEWEIVRGLNTNYPGLEESIAKARRNGGGSADGPADESIEWELTNDDSPPHIAAVIAR